MLNKEKEILQLNLINSQIFKEKEDLEKKNFNSNFSLEQIIEKLNFEVEKNKQISEEIVDLIKLYIKKIFLLTNFFKKYFLTEIQNLINHLKI